MTRTAKRTNDHALHVMTTRKRLDTWRRKARMSGMTLREWVTRTLDAGPIFRVDVKPVAEDPQ